MKRNLLIILALLISPFVWCQTPATSFECHVPATMHDFTQSQIETYLSKSNLETYRLQDTRTTLSFDNGFEVVLLSANEMVHSGLISSSASYQAAYPAKYKMPVFHLTPQGWVTAAYLTGAHKFKVSK